MNKTAEKTATKINFHSGVISPEVIKSMKIGDVLYFKPEQSDILRTRVGEANKANKFVGQPCRWTTFTRTAPLGYVSVTRIN
jgi:hypothetical protein